MLSLAATGCALAPPSPPGSLRVGPDRLAYLKRGQGPALLIVHGVGGHKEDWLMVAEALAPRRTVYAVDMLGFGASSRDAAELGMEAQAAALLALLDAEKLDGADLIGNSVGGWVAATFAARHPTRTRRLVLVDPAGFEAMFKSEPPAPLFPASVAEMRRLLQHVLHSPFAHTEAFAADAYAKFEASGERSLAPRLFPALMASAKLEALLPRVKAPSLVLWGQQDRLFPAQLAPYLAGLLPTGRHELIAEAGHFPHIDQPAAFLAAVQRFLFA
jgi:triacylglycerol lipase